MLQIAANILNSMKRPFFIVLTNFQIQYKYLFLAQIQKLVFNLFYMFIKMAQ